MTSRECASSRFAQGFNCAQAILSAFAERFGLDPDLALRLGAPLGAGLGRTGATCGAVTGALLVLGLRFGTPTPDQESKEEAYRAAQEFMARFRLRHNTVVCRELLACDISTPEGLQYARERGYFTSHCGRFVADAAAILEEML